MKLMHFDIETRGQYKDFETFESNDPQGAKIFRNKYDTYWHKEDETIEEAYLSRCSIVSTYGSICCISMGFQTADGEKEIKSIYGDEEKKIIEGFNKSLEKISRNGFHLSGYNIKHFDIPWVLHKMHKYGIQPAPILDIYNKKPWETMIVDIYEDWKQRAYSTYSFEEVCYELGIDTPKFDMSGKDVHRVFWENDLERIKKYCEADISASIDVERAVYN